MVNQQVLEGHWNEISGYIRERWGQITDNELTQVRGNLQQLLGLIEEKTGWTRERVEHELETLVERGSGLAERASQAARDLAGQAGQRVHEGYDQVSGRIREGYGQAEQLVQRRPVESVAVAFGTGLIAGVIVGLVLRSK